eukprot:11511882-Alexandrium_andersonii.AAC.1
MHRVTMHGYSCPIARRPDVVRCPACLRFYHTVQRTIRHVKRDSPKCAQLVLAHMPALARDTPYIQRRCAK